MWYIPNREKNPTTWLIKILPRDSFCSTYSFSKRYCTTSLAAGSCQQRCVDQPRLHSNDSLRPRRRRQEPRGAWPAAAAHGSPIPPLYSGMVAETKTLPYYLFWSSYGYVKNMSIKYNCFILTLVANIRYPTMIQHGGNKYIQSKCSVSPRYEAALLAILPTRSRLFSHKCSLNWRIPAYVCSIYFSARNCGREADNEATTHKALATWAVEW